MRVLVLGGTRFVGRHVVGECLSRGDEVALLYRGRSPSPFTGLARHVFADRRALTQEAAAILAEPWDAVIDTSAADTDDLSAVVPKLGDVGCYAFVSTCAVYRRLAGCPGLTERSPTVVADGADPARASAIRKLRCERYLRRRLDPGTPLLIARLGLVVGRFDDSNRFAYWLERALRGGDVLVPMDPGQPVQLIDAADVASFLRGAVEQRLSGVVNVAGPRTSARDLLDAVLSRSERPATTWWVGEDFALTNGLRPWVQIPLWLPTCLPERALMSVDSLRAEAEGLVRRPFDETLDDCFAWQILRRGWSQCWLDHVREQELLRQWRGAP